MQLGSNQLLLLRRCETQGYLTIGDVYLVYRFPESPRRYVSGKAEQRARAKLILEKLEMYNLLEQDQDEKGKHGSRWGLQILHARLREFEDRVRMG